MDYPQFTQNMRTALEEMGISAGKEQLEHLFAYLNYLLEENKQYNLTAITDPDEVICKHFLDSLTILSAADLNGADNTGSGAGRSGQTMIDVGTGGGFPGLVIKLFLPEIRLLLLDSQSKKVNFLQQLIARLEVRGVEAVHSRAEDLARDNRYREQFDWVVSRAVAPLNILSEYTLPFSRPGGQAVLYKGPSLEQELEEGKRAVSLLGGELTAVKFVKVPGLEGERYLVFIRKTGTTPDKYPRRAGIPKKRPL